MLTLNVAKTKFLVFRDTKMLFNEDDFQLKIGNQILERVGHNCKKKTFFVGIKLDQLFTLEHQFAHVYKKLVSGKFVLNSCSNVLPFNIRKIVYNSLIQSHLEYGIVAGGGGGCYEVIMKK